MSAPKSAVAPSSSGVLSQPLDEPTRRNGMLVEPQASAADFPLNGTPFSLHYQSSRTSAYGPGYDTFDVPGVGTINAAQFGNYIAGYAAGYLQDRDAYWIVRGVGSVASIGANTQALINPVAV